MPPPPSSPSPSASPRGAFPRLEQEHQLQRLLAELEARGARLAKLKPGDGKVEALLKEQTARLKEAKA
jgi:hypothetical protein